MPAKIGTVVYSALVHDGTLYATHFVTMYNLGPGRAADFRLVGSSFDASGISIPSSRQATFREQLRVTGVASDTADTDDRPYIESKLREAYGARVTVDVEPVRLAERHGGAGR